MSFSPALTPADNGQFDSADIKIEILAPSAYLAGRGPNARDRFGRRMTTNSISAVIKLSYRGNPVVLLTGDVDEIGLDDLIRSKVSIQAPILVFPHHGGNSGAHDMGAFAATLYEQVKPREVLFSIGRGRYETPIPEVVAAARKMIKGVRIACTQLSEHCAAGEPKMDHTHLSSTFAVGRERRYCCAGSIIIALAAGGTTFPILKDHQDFITSFAPNALCRRE
jgi:competence protein ComEC